MFVVDKRVTRCVALCRTVPHFHYFVHVPQIETLSRIVIRAGLNYSNIQILVGKISIQSLNQYSELHCFTYVTLPERGRQTISDTKQRSERGGGRIDILFPFTFNNISGIWEGKKMLREMLTLA